MSRVRPYLSECLVSVVWKRQLEIPIRHPGQVAQTPSAFALRASTGPGRKSAQSRVPGGNDLHVTWFDGRHGLDEIYYRFSPDAGDPFRPEQCLTRSENRSVRPSLAAAGPLVHITWRAEFDSEQILYKRGVRTRYQSPTTALPMEGAP